jgi:hypothetical protein
MTGWWIHFNGLVQVHVRCKSVKLNTYVIILSGQTLWHLFEHFFSICNTPSGPGKNVNMATFTRSRLLVQIDGVVNILQWPRASSCKCKSVKLNTFVIILVGPTLWQLFEHFFSNRNTPSGPGKMWKWLNLRAVDCLYRMTGWWIHFNGLVRVHVRCKSVKLNTYVIILVGQTLWHLLEHFFSIRNTPSGPGKMWKWLNLRAVDCL